MPLFEYRCTACGAVLELFQQAGDPSPALCGYRCPSGPGDENPDRGFGALERILSPHAGVVRSALVGDTNSDEQMKRAGFTKYVNQGGKLERVFGDQGPKKVKE